MLPGACRFSEDREFADPVWLIRSLKTHPQFCDRLVADTTVRVIDKQARQPGSWALLYLAYVLTGETSMYGFYRRHRHSAIWNEAGFALAPSYHLMRLRFAELEADEHLDAFEACQRAMVDQARRHDRQIGVYVDVDGSAFQVNARIVHACPDRDTCQAQPQNAFGQLRRGHFDEVNSHRHSQQRKAAEDAEAPDTGARRIRRLTDQQVAERGLDDRYAWFTQHGHLFRARDRTAGLRRMTRQGAAADKVWFGGTHLVATDRYTGARLAVQVIAADRQEYHAYPDLIEGVRAATGTYPDAVAGDKGFSLDQIYEFNARHGIGSAFPYRKRHHDEPDRDQMDDERYDRHGVPRCQHCGGPGDITAAGLGLDQTGGQPRLRFQCMLGHTPACAQRQSIRCDENWRMLNPLSRLTETYHALRRGNQTVERVHQHARDRFAVAGNQQANRPRRCGLPCAHLRSVAALVIEWYWLCLHNGWIGTHRTRNTQQPYVVSGRRWLDRVIAARYCQRVDRPYGPAAVALGLVDDPEPDPPPDGDPDWRPF